MLTRSLTSHNCASLAIISFFFFCSRILVCNFGIYLFLLDAHKERRELIRCSNEDVVLYFPVVKRDHSIYQLPISYIHEQK